MNACIAWRRVTVMPPSRSAIWSSRRSTKISQSNKASSVSSTACCGRAPCLRRTLQRSTSNLIANVTARPQDVVGLHFFSPANVMRLLEVVRGDRTSTSTLATALRFGKRIGKTSVVTGVCDGFIGNRMFEEYLRQAYALVDQGVLPIPRRCRARGLGYGDGSVRE